jgi:SAM-dependent methyltransferase
VAEYFVPYNRDPKRNAELINMLRALWSQDWVSLIRCDGCSFAFPEPYISAGAQFYQLVYENATHYPRFRWEYGRTVEALQACLSESARPGPVRLLECGAGVGRFLGLLSDRPRRERFELEATEFNHGAREELERHGIKVTMAPIEDLAEEPGWQHRFDALCMFHVLEHMAPVDAVFSAMRKILVPGGHVFISVPSGESIDQQEQLVQCWDMPPNHVGRWSPTAFQRVAGRHGMRMLEHTVEPAAQPKDLWRLAVWSVNARAFEGRPVDELVNRAPRLVRGPAKRILALSEALGLVGHWGSFLGHSLWVHLEIV